MSSPGGQTALALALIVLFSAVLCYLLFQFHAYGDHPIIYARKYELTIALTILSSTLIFLRCIVGILHDLQAGTLTQRTAVYEIGNAGATSLLSMLIHRAHWLVMNWKLSTLHSTNYVISSQTDEDALQRKTSLLLKCRPSTKTIVILALCLGGLYYISGELLSNSSLSWIQYGIHPILFIWGLIVIIPMCRVKDLIGIKLEIYLSFEHKHPQERERDNFKRCLYILDCRWYLKNVMNILSPSSMLYVLKMLLHFT